MALPRKGLRGAEKNVETILCTKSIPQSEVF